MAIQPVYDRAFDEDVDDHEPELTSERSCEECHGRLRTRDGETACTECGLLIREYRLDHRPAPFYEDDDKQPRTGAPLSPTLHDYGLTTEIGYRKDAAGNTLPVRKRRQLTRLRRHHSNARWGTTANKNLGRGFSEIGRLTTALEMPGTIREQACTILRAAQREDLFSGRSIDALAPASVYAALRCLGLPWTLPELAGDACCDVSAARQSYNVLNREIELPTRPVRPKAFIPRFASALDVPARVRRRAGELVEQAAQDGLTMGSKPSGVAAGALYLAARKTGVSLTQVEIAETTSVTPVTLRRHYKRLAEAEVESS
ncbi:transcription initiation factor IIB [Halorussus halophilus]|uniref:transcription initiation factor IIB n=1 Tax=Halorussus halophilus TaxID=2650975 RepID=UPI001301000F|nr:transcription initiation factor IIB family protein [Halorussus halophilus]